MGMRGAAVGELGNRLGFVGRVGIGTARRSCRSNDTVDTIKAGGKVIVLFGAGLKGLGCVRVGGVSGAGACVAAALVCRWTGAEGRGCRCS